MAKTYSRLPHEIIALEPEDFAIAKMCVDAADAETAMQIGRTKFFVPIVDLRI